MANAIDLGTVTTSGGRTRLSGSSSQIDTSAVVEAVVEAKRLPAVRLEAKIKQNEAWKAKLRQVVQIYDEFENVGRGVWKLKQAA